MQTVHPDFTAAKPPDGLLVGWLRAKGDGAAVRRLLQGAHCFLVLLRIRNPHTTAGVLRPFAGKTAPMVSELLCKLIQGRAFGCRSGGIAKHSAAVRIQSSALRAIGALCAACGSLLDPRRNHVSYIQ